MATRTVKRIIKKKNISARVLCFFVHYSAAVARLQRSGKTREMNFET